MNIRSGRTLGLPLLALLALLPAAVAEKWVPFKFRDAERYEFRTQVREEDRMVEGGYVLELKPTDRKGPEGQALVEVSVTTRSFCPKDQLESDAVGQVWGRHGFNFAMMALNPMYAVLFQQLDLKEGEKLSFFGAGSVKVVGKERIAGRDGFVCQFLQQEEGEREQVAAEYVIDPALALPLRSKLFDGGQLQTVIDLVSYSGK